MTEQQTEQQVGPIDYLVLEFPGARLLGKGLPALLDLVERGIIRILDLRVAKVTDTGVVGVALADLSRQDPSSLAFWAANSSSVRTPLSRRRPSFSSWAMTSEVSAAGAGAGGGAYCGGGGAYCCCGSAYCSCAAHRPA